MASLTDIFGQMNEIIQGHEVTIMDAAERMKALLTKLTLWKRGLEADNCANFPVLEVLQQDGSESNIALSASLQAVFFIHLDTLENSCKGYFDSGHLQVKHGFVIHS